MIVLNQNTGAGGKESPVGRVKASWFQNASFRRAVSMAIDREAIIRSVWSGRAVKSWAQAAPGDKVWGVLDVPHDDYDPEAARKMLASLSWSDTDGDGMLEDAQGHPVTFTLMVSTNNQTSVATANFIRDGDPQDSTHGSAPSPNRSHPNSGALTNSQHLSPAAPIPSSGNGGSSSWKPSSTSRRG